MAFRKDIDPAEIITILSLCGIAIVSMLYLDGGKEIALAVGSGLIGYLTKGAGNGAS